MEGQLLARTRTSRHVRFSAARGGEADISRRMRAVTIYEYAPLTPTNTPCSTTSIDFCRSARTTASRWPWCRVARTVPMRWPANGSSTTRTSAPGSGGSPLATWLIARATAAAVWNELRPLNLDPIYLARFHVTVVAPPAEECGSVNIRSSALTVKASSCSLPSRLGNVERSTRKVKLLLASLTT